jgi:gliding motility-associated-like protein
MLGVLRFFFLWHLSLWLANSTFGQLRADFSSNVTSGCLPMAVAFRDLSTGNPDRWKWEVGDGRTFTLQNPSLVYLQAGSYTVKLTIYKGENDSASITKSAFINVYRYPEVNFSADNLEGCIPHPVRFSNSSIPGSGTLSEFNWDFGDGTSGSDRNPLHIYRATGRYNVTLTVKNSFGCQSSFTIPNYIRILDSIKANFTFSTTGSCEAPFPVSFQDQTIGNGVVGRFWDFGDGTTSNQVNPNHQYTQPGNYQITLVATNNQGCADTIRKNINVVAGNFSASFNAPAEVCRGPLVSFQNTSTPLSQIDSVLWDFGDGSISRAISPEKGFDRPGDYNVQLTTFFGTCKVTTSKPIRILSGPTTLFEGTPLEACLPPLTVRFTNQTTNGTVFRWNLGNGVRTPTTNPTVTYEEIGSYTVSLITVNASGCYDTLTKPNYVKVSPPRVTSVPGLPYVGCFPWTQTLRPQVSSISPVTKWEWDFGDGRTSTEATPTISYNERGTYTINLKITTATGCVDSVSYTVQGGFKPGPDFTADPLFVCTGGNVNFFGTVKNRYDQLKWFFGDGGTAVDLLEPSNLYKDTGSMTVTFIAIDNGCVDSLVKEAYIYVVPPYANFSTSFSCDDRYTRAFVDSSFGAETWFWEFGNGDTSVVPSPTYVYPEPGNYKVTLTVTAGECFHKKSIDVNIYDEFPDFISEPNSTCSENIMKFTAQGDSLNLNNLSTLQWRFSDIGNLATTSPVITRRFTEFRELSLRLTVTDLNGCTRAITKPVSVKINGPKARILPLQTLACLGSTVSFGDSSIRNPEYPIIRWTWNYGDGQTVSYDTPPFEHVYADTGFYNLSLKVEDINGCVDSVFLPWGVGIFSPVASFWTADTVICPNTDVAFVNESKGAGLKFFWEFGDGTTSNVSLPTKQYAKEGRYDVSLEVTDSANCKSRLLRPQYIDVGGLLSSFEVSDTFANCPPLRVTFTNYSRGAIRNSWNFGNGNSSLLENPIQTYTEIGDFAARLVVTGKGGCTDTMTRIISVQGPQGEITYNPLTGCPPLKVDFVSATKNVKTFVWDFSDGTTEFTSDSTVTHIYENPGTYRPRVILEDGQNCRVSILGKEDIKVVGVRSVIAPLPTFTYCDSATIFFADSSITNDQIRKWEWDFGDGKTSSLPNPVNTYDDPGRYRVSLFVETTDNCTSQSFLPGEVIISQTPKFEFFHDTLACLPVIMQFSSRVLNPDTTTLQWKWNFGNGTTSSEANPRDIVFDRAGTYSIRVSLENEFGCVSSLTQPLLIRDTPTLAVNDGLITCRGTGISLRATGALEYRWDAQPTLSCTDCANPIATPLTDQWYRVTGSNGPADKNCERSRDVLVKVMQPQNAVVSAGDTLCLGERFQITASGADRYQWSPAAGLSATNIPNPVARPQQTTTYRLIASDSLNCFRDTLFVPIVVYPPPTVKILEPLITGIVGNRIRIATQSSDVTRWRWSPATGLSCIDCPEPEVTISRSESYRVHVTNPGGCVATDMVNVEPICTGDGIFVPNTFSPNGDGRNDIFYPMGSGPASLKSFKIFNRWGEMVFERNNFQANDPSAGWDGTFKGKALTPDVYVYLIVVLCYNNQTLDIKGNVTLLR